MYTHYLPSLPTKLTGAETYGKVQELQKTKHFIDMTRVVVYRGASEEEEAYFFFNKSSQHMLGM